MSKRILLVGHCNIDGPRLKREIGAAISGADVVRVNSNADLESELGHGPAVLLVNREPVGFDQMGVDIIRKVVADHPEHNAVLISDQEDAQEEAVEAGAKPGFGKMLLGTPALGAAVEKVLV